MRAAWIVQGMGFLVILGAIVYVSNPEHEGQEMRPADRVEMSMNTPSIIVQSPAFAHEETIPSKYTCDGEDISPPLAIDSVPQNTISLVLIVEDPDAPGGTWVHWIAFNIPGTVSRIGEGDAPPGLSGTNSWGNTGYGGPCPPNGEHRYLFRIYALDTILDLPEGAINDEVLAATEGHVLESTTLMGRYKRP